MAHPLPLTGERTLPGVPGEEYWFARHEAVYRWIVDTWADRLRQAVVVEAGSGEGYGAALLHEAGARAVVALEYDDASVRHARSTYSGVLATRANLAALPLAAGSADVLVCLQVVEHLWDLRTFLRACARVLRRGGLVVVSTPNRPVFSPGLARGEKPTNPFHVEEFDADQLRELLTGAGFEQVRLLGLHHGPRIRDWEARHGVGLVEAQVAVSLGRQEQPPGLAECVASVTVHDFVVSGPQDAEDLVAVAVAP